MLGFVLNQPMRSKPSGTCAANVSQILENGSPVTDPKPPNSPCVYGNQDCSCQPEKCSSPLGQWNWLCYSEANGPPNCNSEASVNYVGFWLIVTCNLALEYSRNGMNK